MYTQDVAYPQDQLHQKKIDKSSHYPQKKRVLTITSLIRWRDVSFPSKTLLFLSLQRVQKITCGINKIPFFFAFVPKAPSQAKRWSLTKLEITQKIPKQLYANSQRRFRKRSFCGTLTLLKSTLWNLPIYFLSLVIIPATIANQLEKIMRDFFWNTIASNRSIGMKYAVLNKLRPLHIMKNALKTKCLSRFTKGGACYVEKCDQGKIWDRWFGLVD